MAAAAFVALVLVFLFAPVAVVIGFSFNSSPRLSFPFTGLTTSWYTAAFSDPAVQSALRNTITAAVSTGAVAGLLGALFAFGMIKFGRRQQQLARAAIIVPAIVPWLLLALSLSILFTDLHIRLGLKTAIVGHIVLALPFVALVIAARLDQFDFRVIEAAQDLGASRLRAFWSITFPIMLPTLQGAALLAMAISVDEFVVTYFTSGGTQTLPVFIWGLMRLGIDPRVNAIATVILSTSVLLAIAAFLRARADVSAG